MSLRHHQQHQLDRIETGLLRADLQLAAMLGIFGRLAAGQAMPFWEQVPARRDRVRQAAALTVQAVTLAAAASLLLSKILALLIVVGTRHGPRFRPHPGPSAPAAAAEPTAARTRPGRADGRWAPAWPAGPPAARRGGPRTAFVLAGGAAWSGSESQRYVSHGLPEPQRLELISSPAYADGCIVQVLVPA